MATAISVQALTKRFKNDVLANDNVSLDVPAGNVFGLLGPNGAGKTTLIRQLTGELLPTSGDLSVLGIDVLREPARAKSMMGIVPQESGPIGALLVREHLEIFGMLHGLSRKVALERAEILIDELELRAFLRRPTYQLSVGVVRKMLVGMAITSRPPVLVLDEPTTGLDPTSRLKVWSIIREHQRQGGTVLLTTHYMEEAEALCQQVAILGQGRILATGSVDEIRALSEHPSKATYTVEGETRTVFGHTQDEVLAEVKRLGAVEFSIGKATLEDLYLEITAQKTIA